MLNGLHISSTGSMWWYKNDELHREDGPAVIMPNGQYNWYLYGTYVSKNMVLDTPEKRRNWEIEETIRKL